MTAVAALAVAAGFGFAAPARAENKEIVYLTPGLDLPFWRYLSKGIEAEAKKEGYSYTALDSHNSAETQLKNAQDAIARGVAGIAISPTDSSTAPSVLALAARAKIPVVVADIGTNGGEYVSFVISDNKEGAHGVGVALAEALKEKGWTDGSIGLITISQARKNGQARTAGFREAMKEAGITKEAGLQQMQTYTADETFKFTQDMLTANPNMRGMFIQTDQPTIGAPRDQGGASRGHAAGRGVRRHPGVRRFVEERRDRRLGHAAALSDGRQVRRGAGDRVEGRQAGERDSGADRDRDQQEHRPDPADHQANRFRQRTPVIERAGAARAGPPTPE
jgi:ABC-type sugar transport system substrate-binding protein